jgi:hypothetical protein
LSVQDLADEVLVDDSTSADYVPEQLEYPDSAVTDPSALRASSKSHELHDYHHSTRLLVLE